MNFETSEKNFKVFQSLKWNHKILSEYKSHTEISVKFLIEDFQPEIKIYSRTELTRKQVESEKYHALYSTGIDDDEGHLYFAEDLYNPNAFGYAKDSDVKKAIRNLLGNPSLNSYQPSFSYEDGHVVYSLYKEKK